MLGEDPVHALRVRRHPADAAVGFEERAQRLGSLLERRTRRRQCDVGRAAITESEGQADGPARHHTLAVGHQHQGYRRCPPQRWLERGERGGVGQDKDLDVGGGGRQTRRRVLEGIEQPREAEALEELAQARRVGLAAPERLPVRRQRDVEAQRCQLSREPRRFDAPGGERVAGPRRLHLVHVLEQRVEGMLSLVSPSSARTSSTFSGGTPKRASTSAGP